MASSLTAQSTFLNNFENIVNRRVDIHEDIKRYQGTLSYASSKVDDSVWEHLYMLPSDMTLKIRLGTVRYDNKILVSDEKFILGKNEKVNSLEAPSAPQMETPVISHKGSNVVTQTAVTHKNSEKIAVTQEQKNNYYPRRRENCFNSFFNWNIYDMGPVSIKSIH